MGRRTRGVTGKLTRRNVLLGMSGSALLGLGASSFQSSAFSSVIAPRATAVDVVADGDAFVGLTIYSPVKRNEEELLAEIENNVGELASVTVSLDDPNHGTLSADGNSGDSVTFSLGSGSIEYVYITADAKDATVPFTITLDSPNFWFEATRETYAESGNTKGAVNVKKVDGFSANHNSDDWSIKSVVVRSNNHGLDRVEYKITDGNGDVVATRTDNATGTKYQAKKLTIGPDDGSYQVQRGESYTLKVTGYDVEGNFDTATRSDTA